MSHIDQMPQLHTGSFLTKEQAEQFKEAFKNLTVVVRCKDCKNGQYEEWDNGECVDKTIYCDEYGIHNPEWFCADGERRTE